MKNLKGFLSKEDGVSTIQIIVASAIIGSMGVMFIGQYETLFKVQRTAEVRNERQTIVDTIKQSLSDLDHCTASLNAGGVLNVPDTLSATIQVPVIEGDQNAVLYQVGNTYNGITVKDIYLSGDQTTGYNLEIFLSRSEQSAFGPTVYQSSLPIEMKRDGSNNLVSCYVTINAQESDQMFRDNCEALGGSYDNNGTPADYSDNTCDLRNHWSAVTSGRTYELVSTDYLIDTLKANTLGMEGRYLNVKDPSTAGAPFDNAVTSETISIDYTFNGAVTFDSTDTDKNLIKNHETLSANYSAAEGTKVLNRGEIVRLFTQSLGTLKDDVVSFLLAAIDGQLAKTQDDEGTTDEFDVLKQSVLDKIYFSKSTADTTDFTYYIGNIDCNVTYPLPATLCTVDTEHSWKRPVRYLEATNCGHSYYISSLDGFSEGSTSRWDLDCNRANNTVDFGYP